MTTPTLNVPCRLCGAEIGQLCRNRLTNADADGFHRARIKLAASVTLVGKITSEKRAT